MLGRLFVVCHLSKHFSTFHSVVIVCAGDFPLLFKLLLKFRNVLKHTDNRSSLACNQNIKGDIPTHWRFSFALPETKRNNIHVNWSFTKTTMQRASNIGGRAGYNGSYMGDSLYYLENLLVKHNVYSRVACNRLWKFRFRNFTIPLCNCPLLVFFFCQPS